MGLGRSKARSQVTKVAPMPANTVVPQPPGSVAVYGFQSPLRERSSSSFASLTERHSLSERYLPPLRETLYARYPAEPSLNLPDLKTEEGGPSIIKQHPPRRPQKLEPLIFSKDIPLDKLSRQLAGTSAWTPQELEKRGAAGLNPTGRRRQHLHKMKMLEMRQEAERKRQLRQEAKLTALKMRDFKGQRKPDPRLHVDSSDDDDDDDDLSVDPWTGQILRGHGLPKARPGQISKVESWLLNQQARKESFWDAWSTDSDSWKGSDEGRLSRRPVLVRTKTERIRLSDEFFDQEF